MTAWPMYANNTLGDCQEAAIAHCIQIISGRCMTDAEVLASYNHWFCKYFSWCVSNVGKWQFKFFGMGGVKPKGLVSVTRTQAGFEAALAQYKAVSVGMYGHQVAIFGPAADGVRQVTGGAEYPLAWKDLLSSADSTTFAFTL